ncbi:MAG TPA: hypothetical protein VF718_04200 [Allosphingosinicella sp.]|jgi:hypothetical protein
MLDPARFRLKSPLAALGLGFALALAGPAASAPVPLSSVTEGAVVVRKFDPDLTTRFAFARTVGAILGSAAIPNTPANRQALVASLVATFNASQQVNPVSGLAMKVDPRPAESGLSPAQLLDPAHPRGLMPIGLFSRFDLAPADWSDCGEHRIVYGNKPGQPRFFLIFEAKIPNPSPSLGIKGCRPLAMAWRAIGLSTTAAGRNARLEQLYYAGIPNFRAAVHHLNYGTPLGQVRSNSFVQGPWQLREFRILAVAPGVLQFRAAPAASNPLAEFYKDNPAGTALEQSERTKFRIDFGNLYQPRLRSVDSTEPLANYRMLLFNTMGAGFELRSSEFQSSVDPSDDPSLLAGTQIRGVIPASWTAPAPFANRTISEAQMLNRATVITCAGCHQPASRQVSTVGGTPIIWPNSLGFVHISEFVDASGNHPISDALSFAFVPFRRQALLNVANSDSAALPAGLTALQLRLFAPASPTARASALSRRSTAETLSRQILRAGRAGDSVIRDQALTLERLSDEGHQREMEERGAFMEFRRPH